LDLTLDYGTAAIKYENGTIIDVGKVDGSEEYRAMMQHFTATNQYYYFPTPSSNYTIDTLTNMLQQLVALIVKHLSSSSYPHEFINPLPLPSSAYNALPKDMEFFPYSVHIAMRNSDIIPYDNIESALQAARLSNRGFYIHGRSYDTVMRAQPSTFADPDFATIIDISNSSTSLLEESKFVLAVEYTASALSLNVFSYDRYANGDRANWINGWEGSVTRPDLGVSVARKLSADDLQTYYKDVEKFINYTIKQHHPRFQRFPEFQGFPGFQRFPWDYDGIERLNLSSVEEDKPMVHALLMFGDQPFSGKISLLKPLQNSLGFNDIVASTLERLDQMDTLYEGARGAASAAKKVSGSFYPSKPTCSDAEIAKYYREHFMFDRDDEAEVINTSNLILPDVEGNEDGMVVAIIPDIKDEEMSEALLDEVLDDANFIAEPLGEKVREKGDAEVEAEAEGYLRVQNELRRREI
jgi:hypothetical protein